jgi:hypothetical protein
VKKSLWERSLCRRRGGAPWGEEADGGSASSVVRGEEEVSPRGEVARMAILEEDLNGGGEDY